MLETSCPKTNNELSNLWTKINASYKSNLRTKKVGNRNFIHKQVTLVKYNEW